MNDILLFLQLTGDKLSPLSRELIAASRTLAQEKNARVCGMLAIEILSEAAEKSMRECGLDEIDIYLDAAYHVFDAQQHCAALNHCVSARRPAVLLLGASLEGRSLAPMVAATQKSGVTADCTALAWDDAGSLLQTRPAFGEEAMAQIRTEHTLPQIATVRQGALRAMASAERTAQTHLCFPAFAAPLSPFAIQRLDAAKIPKMQSEIGVALGGALREEADITRFHDWCETRGADLYCSRALVERGWLPQGRQIGLSGQSPQLRVLLTFGISGSLQFSAGLGGAEKLIAVNSDPKAPILRRADLPLVGDMYELLMELEKMNL